MTEAFSFTRRVFLRKAAQHAPAAAALAVLPIATTIEPVAADPINECERLAAELAGDADLETQDEDEGAACEGEGAQCDDGGAQI